MKNLVISQLKILKINNLSIKQFKILKMKNVIIIALLSFAPMFIFAQINVKAPNSDVGIGTDIPLGKLHVDGGNLLLENGRIGIGVTAPARPFHMRASNTVFRLDRDSNSPGFIMARFPNGDYSGDALESFSMIVNGYDDAPGYLALTDFNGKVGGASERVFLISSTGSLIVDNATAQDPDAVIESDYRLHVQGDAFKSDGGDLWNVLSDKRLKRNIKKYKGGLDLIKKLNPVTYEYNGKAGTKAGQKHIGVVAQELQKVAPEMVSTFRVTTADDGGIEYIDGKPDGVVVTRTEHEYLSINASNLKWMMVDAIQGQQEIIETQKDEIATLKERLGKIETLLNSPNPTLNQQNIQLDGRGAYLEQNQPNPFNTNTLIKYNVPTDTKNALISIFNKNGQLVHNEAITQMGTGEIQVKAGTISAGTYSYSLVVNGKITDTKRMVIVK